MAGPRRGNIWYLVLGLSTFACEDEKGPARAERRGAGPVLTAPVLTEPPALSPEDPCELLISTLMAAPELPGTPTLDDARAEILARARSVPVAFLRAPGSPSAPNERVQMLRQKLKEVEDPVHAIQKVLSLTRGDYEMRRAVFLPEQYFYADSPLLALRLSQILRLDHLFKDDALVIRRGAETITAVRQDGRYFEPTHPDAQSKQRHHPALANLLLFDRVRAEKDKFGESLHVDLRPLVRELGTSRLRLKRTTRDGIVAEADTLGSKSELVLRIEEDAAKLECERPLTDKEALQLARRAAREEQELIAPVLSAAHDMILQGLPFDEPRTEEGQQDGLLRLHFRQAFQHYGYQYEFNGDQYYVFDGFGRARVPQVCIDFITDAFDWGTGGGWSRRGEKREYRKGALHFGSLGIENSRSIESVAEFATQTPEWFDMRWLSEEEQVKFRHRTKFFQALARDADDYRLGDVVFIYGLKDDGKFHFHSFLIGEKDPVTGIPMVVLANAGPPQARSWEGEMQNAPLRKIVARMRVKRELLRRAQEQARTRPGVPLLPPARPFSHEELR